MILGPKRNSSLGRYVNEFIQIISFFEQSSFKLRCETVLGIVLCYSHQACCLLYYLCEITSNNGIHISFPDVTVVSDLNKNIGGSADLHTPVHPSPYDCCVRQKNIYISQYFKTCFKTLRQS